MCVPGVIQMRRLWDASYRFATPPGIGSPSAARRPVGVPPSPSTLEGGNDTTQEASVWHPAAGVIAV